MVDDARPVPLWSDGGELPARRAPLGEDADTDVVLVGGGFTGLWTAYYLSRRRPDLRVTILEAEHVGFGASGRNGGWCSAELPMSLTRLATSHGLEAAQAMHREMNSTVAEIGRVVADEGIDCGWAHGGYLHLARNAAQRVRLRDELDGARAGALAEGAQWLDPPDVATRVAASNVLGAVYTPHCAALDPGRLIRALAPAVERSGARIYEGTRVERIEPGQVRAGRHVVRARWIVRATEAYSARLRSARRAVVPLYSLMIATEPLPDEVWSEIGWSGRETINDARRMIVYAQRTADGRIAFGGRGAPYHFGSKIAPKFDLDVRVHRHLQESLYDLFPATVGARITHRWGGPLGAARDWHASVGLDPGTGLGWGGGYVGDGVATSNLAGRTLAGLIAGQPDELSQLPWVGHRSPRWEPEPVRWLAIRSALGLTRVLDRADAAGRPARRSSALLSRIVGG